MKGADAMTIQEARTLSVEERKRLIKALVDIETDHLHLSEARLK